MSTSTEQTSWFSQMTNFLGEKGADPKHSMASEGTAFIYSTPAFQFQACALFFPNEIQQKLRSVISQRRKAVYCPKSISCKTWPTQAVQSSPPLQISIFSIFHSLHTLLYSSLNCWAIKILPDQSIFLASLVNIYIFWSNFHFF